MMKKVWKVYFTSWDYDLADAMEEGFDYEAETEEEAWKWVEEHEEMLEEGEESYAVVKIEE